MQDYWHKQKSEPVFASLAWARPETKHTAGKLLIIGGHAQSFAVPAEAYVAAEAGGIGVVRVMLPSSLSRTVSKLFPAAEYAPSNPSGSFGAQSLAELLDASNWADGVLVAGDIAKNSETIAMLENLSGKYAGILTFAHDAVEPWCTQPAAVLARKETLLVLDISQLQKLGTSLHLTKAFTSTDGMVQLVEKLHDMTTEYPQLYIATQHESQTVIAVGGQVSTSECKAPVHAGKLAATATTWWLQNPTKPFEALTTAALNPS